VGANAADRCREPTTWNVSRSNVCGYLNLDEPDRGFLNDLLFSYRLPPCGNCFPFVRPLVRPARRKAGEV
jgi:hypothetical protein